MGLESKRLKTYGNINAFKSLLRLITNNIYREKLYGRYWLNNSKEYTTLHGRKSIFENSKSWTVYISYLIMYTHGDGCTWKKNFNNPFPTKRVVLLFDFEVVPKYLLCAVSVDNNWQKCFSIKTRRERNVLDRQWWENEFVLKRIFVILFEYR